MQHKSRTPLGTLATLTILTPLVCGCGRSIDSSAATIADAMPSLDSSFAGCNASTACNLTIPVGTFSFSVAISPRAMFSIQGAGASFDNPGIPTTPQFPTIETHCLTTLVWMGGPQRPFTISSYHLQGSKLTGFCLDARGSAPDTFIEIDHFAGGVDLEDVVIDTPHTQARTAAIRYGSSG